MRMSSLSPQRLLCLLIAIWPAITAAADAQTHSIDEGRVRAAEIRKLAGRRLTLYTDLPSSQSVDELPEVFDQAFPQWCAYFGVDEKDHADWRMTGYLIKDKVRFTAAGLLPDDLPPFLNGYCRGHELWVYNQPSGNQTSDYYRRHLLLHEGTHGFMFTVLRGCGPPWYSEGMAELLATHRWADGHLQLNRFPSSPAEVSKLGRIEIVENDVARHHARSIGEVLAYDSHAHLKVEPYAWSWAAVEFLDSHPRYRERFRELWKSAGDPKFNKRLAETFASDGAELAEEFQVFAADIAYGYDFEHTALDFTAGKPMSGRRARITVAADRGWQNSGVKLEAGKTYRLAATGRYQVAKRSHVLYSEPGGVSIRYFHGKPLGVLLGAVRPDGPSTGDSPLASPLTIGLGAVVRPEKTGTLYFRANVSPGELDSAAGTLTVDVVRE